MMLPEFCVSVFSGASGHVNLSVGNAYGSCIFNILGVLGISAVVAPLVVKPIISYIAAPLLTLTAIFSLFLLRDHTLGRIESWSLLGVFAVAMPIYCWIDNREHPTEDDAASADGGSQRFDGCLQAHRHTSACRQRHAVAKYAAGQGTSWRRGGWEWW